MADTKAKQEKDPNPIDRDKVADSPHNLPYAHTVGGVEIRPEDKGRLRGRAVTSMYQQTDRQLEQIREQIELLARQAQSIQDRVRISEEIYEADIPFEPLPGKTYHLYRRSNGKALLAMVGPREWGSAPPYAFVASVRLHADHTWEVLDHAAE